MAWLLRKLSGGGSGDLARGQGAPPHPAEENTRRADGFLGPQRGDAQVGSGAQEFLIERAARSAAIGADRQVQGAGGVQAQRMLEPHRVLAHFSFRAALAIRQAGREVSMAEEAGKSDAELKARILAMLDENRIMSIATVRPDGWPQTTLVGYIHDELTLYFAIARTSQKLANIQRDPRVSIAIGQDSRDRIRGLSMAARASEVTDFDEIRRLNVLIGERYPEQAVFAPREASAAVLRVRPEVISVIDLTKGPGAPELAQVVSETAVRRLG
jgi:general stress protein 26